MFNVLSVIANLIIAAHFYRHSQYHLVTLVLMFLGFLFFKSKENFRIYQGFLVFAIGLWTKVFYEIALDRFANQTSYLRLLVIGFGVVSFYVSLLWYSQKKIKQIDREGLISPSIAFFITFGLLLVVVLTVKTPMLLGNRFFGEWGILQIFFHALYSSKLVQLFLVSSPKKLSAYRINIWLFFSFAFFLQLILGLIGLTPFLQTGTLHYPVPSLIISAPIYRGEGFFMPILLLTTIILSGSAWCSQLCYIGALDQLLAKISKSPQKLTLRQSKIFPLLRWGNLLLAVVLPILYISLDITSAYLHITIIFYIAFSLYFFYLSSRYGKMMHCTYCCPIGLLTNWLGKINPFRIRINQNCTSCGNCFNSCYSSSLNSISVKQGRPEATCNLCLDCIPNCHTNAIELTFGSYRKYTKPVFYTVVICLHSIFLALARM